MAYGRCQVDRRLTARYQLERGTPLFFAGPTGGVGSTLTGRIRCLPSRGRWVDCDWRLVVTCGVPSHATVGQPTFVRRGFAGFRSRAALHETMVRLTSVCHDQPGGGAARPTLVPPH